MVPFTASAFVSQHSPIGLTMSDFPHSPVLARVNVQTIRAVVHGAHVALTEHAMVLWQVLLREGSAGVGI